VKNNCLGVEPQVGAKYRRSVLWPHGRFGSFAIPGNHEYYSGGGGFFQHFMPSLGVLMPKNSVSV
jgi:hypothetical protein